MFVRMLKLADEARLRHDLSSMHVVVHAAAPCPVEVKQRMLDWWGPVVFEYDAGTENNGFCSIAPQEWLQHPGSVGRASEGVLQTAMNKAARWPKQRCSACPAKTSARR